ncbi:MAG: L-threonylcarbamoyladenylate synthase [Lachnospiraceae bacterium]
MKTEIVYIEEACISIDEIREVSEWIKKGELVAFPTETVYGLGGDALDPMASQKIYAAKGRPSDNPLIIHISKWEDVFALCSEVPQQAQMLADAFWPGPLTMVLSKSELVPYETTGGLDTVAVRMPSHKVALAFIDAAGGYIAAPSANVSGRPSPTLAKYVMEDMDGKIPCIIDGGDVGIGVESTIIDLTEEIPVILRPGYITQRMLQEVVGRVEMDHALAHDTVREGSLLKPKAPGMKYRHYAPKGSLLIVSGESQVVAEHINHQCEKAEKHKQSVCVLCTEETRGLYEKYPIKIVGSRADETSIARGLYKTLRECDDEAVEVILAEGYQSVGVGEAIMNRLLKAAGHNIIYV